MRLREVTLDKPRVRFNSEKKKHSMLIQPVEGREKTATFVCVQRYTWKYIFKYRYGWIGREKEPSIPKKKRTSHPFMDAVPR
jgi:hypothetical protein